MCIGSSMKYVVCVISYIALTKGWLILDSNLILTNTEDRIARYYRNISNRNVGEPLLLTPYIENGNINEAKNSSYIKPFIDNVISYSGFFTVDKKYNSNMFFWYFKAEEEPDNAPVILWLQGGPGGSSLYGLFVENGPYRITKNNKIAKRSIYWSKTMHVIYIDNPVGTGYSFTNSEDGFSTNQTIIGKHLYNCLQQFFTMFPELRKNEFYISGESYAGKYIPALGYTIHQNNPKTDAKINLKGLAIGNGLSDPINQLDYGSYLYGIELIDEKGKEDFSSMQDYLTEVIQMNYNVEAHLIFNILIGSDDSLFSKLTGYQNVYNYLISENTPLDSTYVHFLNKASTRKAIHVGNSNYKLISNDVYNKLYEDFVSSVSSWVEILADHYKLMMYNGEMDIIVPYPSTVNYVNKLKWCGAEDLESAERQIWRVNDELAGYITSSLPSDCNGSIRLVMVRNAGHSVPIDQPLWAYNLITDFIRATK